jgi:DNA-binding MarR family transcriptional regulator
MEIDVVRDLGYLALGTRLRRLGERLQAQTQEILDAHELPIQAAQFPVLAAIDRLGSPSVGELAEAVGVTQPAATRAIGQLVEAGFVEISATKADQRRKAVVLTREGKRLVDTGKKRVWPLIEGAVANLCRGLSGSLLVQLAAVEDGLAAESLDRRARLRPTATRRRS